MKHLVIIYLTFLFSFSVYSQADNLIDGDKCFNEGNYTCALTKYKEQYKSSNVNDKMDIEIKIQQAKLCLEQLKNANIAFNAKNYTKAKENYLAVLESNPDDEFVKGRLESINVFLTKNVNTPSNPKPSNPKSQNPAYSNSNLFSLSKTEISYRSSGGNEYITVNSISNPYTVELLPSWCTVQKSSTYFSVNCANNYSTSSRSDYFNVKSGNQTIRVNVKQEGSSSAPEVKLEASKTDLFFSYDSGNIETISISTNAIDFNTTYVPNWCYVTKYKSYITVKCQKNDTGQLRSDWFKVYNDKKEIKISVTQSANPKSSTKPPRYNLLGPFSSIGFQSGEIAKYGFIYERGGRKTVGFRISARTSLTSEQDILNGTVTKNKTEIELGPNFRIQNRLYFNIGFGYGYYERLLNNDFAGNVYLEKTGYSVATTGLMYRISKSININAGAAFMDIDKDLYKPEYTFGVTYNLKKNTGQGYNTKPSRNYKTKLSSFSSLGFQSGEIAKYGLLYESGGRKTVGFRISARTTLKPEQIFGGGDIENKKEIELGPNFRMSNRIYLNLGVGYGNYEFPPYQDKIGYYITTTGIMYRISRVININGGLSFNYINNDIYFNNTLQKTEVTFGISFNLRGKYKY